MILAKTVKGFGLGKSAEGQMVAHQQKKLDIDGAARSCAIASISRYRTRIWPICRSASRAEDSDEMRYLQARRKELGGYLPVRKPTAPPLTVPPLEAFRSMLEGTGDREISTTMAFVRILTVLLKDKGIGKHIVPIVPDEARTFGMEGLFRQIGIYSAVGQLYTPVDAETLMSYREDKKGQMLEEGINEAGSTCSWIAAATSYANHGISMVPFYIYYSMFGFQRVGDFIWAAGDMRARGFLLGATAGRTTLAGEGLQHQDGHSQLVATTIPNCRAYDPTYAYELAVIIQDGMQRMYVENESVFYYISVMNENYAQPRAAGRRGSRHHQGWLSAAERRRRASCARRCSAAAPSCANASPPPSCSSSSSASCRRRVLDHQLQRAAARSARVRALESAASGGRCRACRTVQTLLAGREGPLVAATDYVRNVPDQIRPWVSHAVRDARHRWLRPQRRARRAALSISKSIGNFIALAALKALADASRIERKTVIARSRRSSASIRTRPILSPARASREPPWPRKKFIVPDLGDFKDVAVIDVLVKPGDSVQVDTPLLTLETEKATMDVPSPRCRRDREAARRERLEGLRRHLIATLQLERRRQRRPPMPDGCASRRPLRPRPRPRRQRHLRPPQRPPAANACARAQHRCAAAPAPAPAAAQRRRPPRRRLLRRCVSRRRVSRALMPVLRCAGSRASSASIWAASRARGQKGRITEEDVKAFVKSLMARRSRRRRRLPRRQGRRLPKVDVAGLRAVRTDRNQAAEPRAAHLRGRAACELGQPAACHAVR